MSNVSLKGEDVFLGEGKQYFVIDALYLNKVKQNINLIDKSNIEKEIREKVFPYTETPFTEVAFPRKGKGRVKFEIAQIKKNYNEDNIDESFSCDSGLIVFVEKSVLIEFLNDFDYDQLIDTLTESVINLNYWESIENRIGPLNCALILSPGINKGFEFDGSGFYKIEL